MDIKNHVHFGPPQQGNPVNNGYLVALVLDTHTPHIKLCPSESNSYP